MIAGSLRSRTDMVELKEQITIEDFAKLDLRVGRIIACEPHPNADRLLKLQVDLGELGARQICAGIRGYYDPRELVGQSIVVVANLAPRKIRGEESNGMLLAASAQAGGELKDVVILTPLREVPPGSAVG
jgi:tRNA-binding protein